MTEKNERMRAALREIESQAAAALANQPNDANECEWHLNKALAVIELKAHVARWGDTVLRVANRRRGPCWKAKAPKRGGRSGCKRRRR